MVIYKTVNIVNGMIYIGQDVNNNPAYLGSGTILGNAIKKYGKKEFKKEILEYCSSKQEMDIRERYWIKFFNSTDRSIGYNICDGGQGGMILSDEEKEKRGIYDKISNAHKNKSLSEDHKESIRKGLSKYKKKEKYSELTEEEMKKQKIGKYNNFYGHTHKNEENYKEKYTTRKGITPTNAYKVKDIETGKIFESCNAAAQKFKNPNTARRAISAVCKGLRENYKNRKYEFVK